MNVFRSVAGLLPALAFLSLPSFTQTLVKDIDITPPTDLGGSDPTSFVFAGGLAFFVAEGDGTGRELFASDGTPQGTGIVVDLIEGSPSSQISSLTPLGNEVFFFADSPTGRHVFRSDGTEQGTQIFIAAGSPDFPYIMRGHNGYLYFGSVVLPGGGEHYYSYDGVDFETFYVGSTFDPEMWSGEGQWFYFEADGRDLWRTDGTAAGTSFVFDGDIITAFSAANGTVWFMDRSAPPGTSPDPDWELWKTDGTPGGTELVKTLDVTFPRHLTAGEDGCVFSGNLGGSNYEPFYSDGTEAGTIQLGDLLSGSGSFPEDFTPFGTSFLFTAAGEDEGRELWITDGTPAGTQTVKDIFPGSGTSSPDGLVSLGGEVFFRAQSTSDDLELWKSDGTEAGTVQVSDLKTNDSSIPLNLASDGAAVWFSATADTVGTEPHISDGITTAIVSDMAPNFLSDPSEVEFLADLNGKLIFVADDGVHGEELWVSDGTEAGTFLLKDINPFGDISLFGTVLFDEWLYFIEVRNITFTMWATDGTTAGTFEVDPGREAFQMGVSNGKLYFGGETPEEGREPYVLHGKFGTPQLLKAIAPGPEFSYPSLYYPVDDVLTVFKADHPERGDELFVTDGTEEGTELLVDINPGPDSSSPGAFLTMNGEVFFSASIGFNRTIWSTDGTKEGTVMRYDPTADFGFTGISGLTAGDGSLYFTYNGDLFGYDTVADIGTDYLIDDIYIFGIYPLGNELMVLSDDRDVLYRYAGTPGNFDVLLGGSGGPDVGVEIVGDIAYIDEANQLFSTDGTLAGTEFVADISPYSSGGGMSAVTTDGRLLLQGYDVTNGGELWISDGTELGTGLLADIDPGLGSSSPGTYFRAGDRVYFTADDGVTGRELHSVPIVTTGGFLSEGFGTVCAMTTGETPTMTSSGSPVVGSGDYMVGYEDAPPGSGALLFFSPSRGVGTLGGGCALYFGAPYFLYPGPAAITDLDGTGALPAPIPADPVLAGVNIFFQYLVSDPGGLIFGAVAPTNGLELVIGS